MKKPVTSSTRRKLLRRSRMAQICAITLLSLNLAACGGSQNFTEISGAPAQPAPRPTSTPVPLPEPTTTPAPNPSPSPTTPPTLGDPEPSPISIGALVPADIAGGAPNASLQTAAQFAWQEFIALNWPAVPQNGALGTRDVPDQSKNFGDPTYRGPLVWETFRHKAEIFPATGDPHGFAQGAAKDYGYDDLPQYVYPAPAPTGAAGPTPFNNLDESSEISLASMFAGIGPANDITGKQVLYQAKANRTQYKYVAENGWYGAVAPPFAATAAFLATNLKSPTAGSDTLVSFPTGTIELKAAFRKLGPTEDASRFHTQTARHYVKDASGALTYRDDTFALIGLHIIHKTPTAPYFVFATFEQVDNLLDVDGHPIENPDGGLINPATGTPFEPNITSRDAVSANPPTLASIQQLLPMVVNSVPGSRLYFQNSSGTQLPQGTVTVARRTQTIPSDIITINQAAHAAIAAYNSRKGIKSSPWQYYKLVNVQAKPIDKPAGQPYTAADAPTYYLANSVVETDYNLQVFSGRFQQPGGTLTPTQVKDLITDFTLTGAPFKNVAYAGSGYNMGGCMGCHGNAAVNIGSDFSFILAGQRVPDPDPVGEAPANSPRLLKLQDLLQR